MASWAGQRKLTIISIITVVGFGIVVVPLFFLLYKAPTHTDGIQNGGELGIDCGGPAPKLCQNAFMQPSVAWARYEKLAPRLYNVAAYIINPNTEGEAKNVPYHMAIYDARGILITDLYGDVTLPPHRNTIAFKGAVNVGERTPARVFFEFTSAPNWIKKTDTLAPISVEEKKYTEDVSGSSLIVNLKNTSLRPIPGMAVSVVLYDKDGSSIGFSKTYVDGIDPGSIVEAPFTWQIDRKGAVISIEVLPVSE